MICDVIRRRQSVAFGSMAGVEDKKAVLEMVQADGADEGCVTFVLHEEDHTLGNALRYVVMKNPNVEFCGYSITHPSESKINFRIQTRGRLPAVEPLRKGLNDLTEVCQYVLNTFENRVKEFKETQEAAMD
ncbi:DNA-directed RNA polymerases I and III subunit RPAC2 [Conger conger]|uniref:DNA-directed RNA polymerases I and III subunit RPAC2 n=1 Tax=Conger conger TaxID=82655 RepID=UPI002A59C4C7|nr:DNA-directed RNA polymerases I and III subunit RPAC2 [Conger conger]